MKGFSILSKFASKGKAVVSLVVILAMVTFLAPVVPAVKAVTPEFTVNTGTVLASNFIGHGSQYNQNLYAAISAIDGITTENVGYLETKVKQLKSQHVRIFFSFKAFDTVNYPDYMSSFIKTVELAQASGSTVNITYWHGPYTNIPQQMSDFADVLYDLIVTRGLTAVQYITIQNEVNSTSITQATYQQLYRELNTQLTNRGIRGSVKFIGGDLVRTNQQSWFDYMAANMNDVLDGYSIHIYWNHWDRAYANTRLSEVRAIIDAMAPATQKPVYITEYGIRGDSTNCGETFQPGCLQGTLTPLGNTVLNAFQHAWFQMKAMNYKYVATVKWDAYKAKYDNGTQYFSEVARGTDGYPTKPVYNMTRLFTHTSTPGWQVVGVTGAVTGKLVSAMNNPATGAMAVYALNDSAAVTTIAIGGLPATKQFRLLIWNDEATGGIKNYGTVQTDGAGTIAVTLNSQSFAVLTTLNPGDLDQIGSYHLDETTGTTAADASPYINHGTLFNGATWTTGKTGGALDLDGVDDYATLPPNMINPAETTSGFSAAAWVKLRASSAAVQLILQQDGADGRIWLNRRGDGTLETYIGGVATISTGTIPVGVWTHVAVTYDGTNVRLWLNGNLEITNAVTAESASDRMIVGADKTLGQLWNGQIDELTIYNRKLPQPDVEDLYNSGYWKFDETSGSTANDDPATGYNNVGTLFGAGATWTTVGKVNGALDLDGASGYAKLPHLVNPAVQTFSAAAWVKLRATPGTVQQILVQEGTTGRIWLDRKGNGTLETNIGNISTVSVGTIPIGVWTHVAVTYDGTTVKLYRNGQPDGSRVVTAEASTSGMIVGASKTLGEKWNGQIDNLHIYDRRITAANVLDLYNQSR